MCSTSCEALRTPTVVTLHTVLQHPTPSQRRILSELVHAVDGDGRDVHFGGDTSDPLVRD